ncbi:MAG: D-alanyl-D-alanine carboxypeptidase family protein [Anaerolineae bacterium]
MTQRKAIPLSLAFLACLCLAFGPPSLTERDAGGMRITPAQVEALLALQAPPTLLAEAALLGDETTGQVLWEKNAHEPRAVASTTKIMTALIILERAHLDEEVVVSTAAAYTGGNKVGLAPGERLSVRDLLYGLLLNSGNDAATALAEHVAGTTAAFADLMNAKAQALGMAHTHFVNPHGLDAEGHYSSAYDLWLLAREAMKNSTFREIVATLSWTSGARMYGNLNLLLTTYPGADGIKTGTSDWAGECLVASAMRRGHRLIAVVLHSPDRYRDATTLLDWGFAAYDWVPMRLQGRALNRFTLAERECRLALPGARELLLPRWGASLARPFRSITSSAEGEPAAEWRLYLGDTLWLREPLSVRCGAEQRRTP